METTLDKSFWSNRYTTQQTGWDAGTVTTPLKAYFDQLTDQSLRILIPGAGNSHEAEYLWRKGFKNVFVADIAAEPLRNLKERLPDFPEEQLLEGDFFAMQGSFDLIVEQTFFCAISPSLRPGYARQCARLLKTGGKLAGLLFDAPMNTDQPPYGGTREEYRAYFSPYFSFLHFDACYNSIKPREGKEMFITLVKI